MVHGWMRRVSKRLVSRKNEKRGCTHKPFLGTCVARFMLRQGAGPLGGLCWGGISATKIFRLRSAKFLTKEFSSLTTSPIYLIMLPFYHSIEWEFHIFIKRSSKCISKYLQNMYRNIQVCILKIPSKYMSEDLQNVHQINPQNTSRDD